MGNFTHRRLPEKNITQRPIFDSVLKDFAIQVTTDPSWIYVSACVRACVRACACCVFFKPNTGLRVLGKKL